MQSKLNVEKKKRNEKTNIIKEGRMKRQEVIPKELGKE